MKMTLKPLQCRILLKWASHRQIGLNLLVEASLPNRSLNMERRPRWQDEIRLQIDLMAIYGLIGIEEQMGVRVCFAPEFVIAWADAQRIKAVKPGKKQRPSIVLPLIAATLVATATTACSSFPGMTQSTPAPVVSPYNADGTQPPERMEQFYNPKTGNMVYRFCVGSECPEPTPKKPIAHMAIVTEIDGSGNAIPVDQQVSPSLADGDASLAAKPVKKVVDGWKPQAQTAQNNKNAAAVAAQLEQQRRAILEASGAAQAPREAPTAAKLSVKTMGDGSAAGAKPTAPAPTPAPAVKGGGTLQDMLPTTGTRAPEKPQANADVLKMPMLAKAPAADHAVGGIAATEMVTETSVKGLAAAGIANSAEAFIVGWADLWAGKKADAYFGLYASDFWPTYGDAKSMSAFEQQRLSVMVRPGDIKVGVELVKVEDKGDKATVRFWQNYESKSFKSRVLKSMELVKVDGDWKIRRERLIPVPQNPIA